MKGEVVFLYAFDVAYEIETGRVQEILQKKAFPFEIRMDRTVPKDVPLYKPLAIELPLQARIFGRPLRSLIRVYDVGAISIVIRVPFEAASLGDLQMFHNPVLESGEPLDRVAQKLCGDVCRSLADFMVRGTASPDVPEAYTVFCLTDLGSVNDLNEWLSKERRAVAGLLTETEPDRLSEGQVAEVLRIQQSFENTDLAILDWDAALVADLSGYVDDVLYALELANIQLEEFEIMDRRLDRYLDRAYDDMERRSFRLFGAPSLSLQELRRFRIDVTKLRDEVTHITKFFGDWYLARVYSGARDRFALDQWRASVEERLGQLDQIYNVVYSEINEKRMLFLELLIVVFFAIDILMMLLLKK
jgi:hypothetical protein